MGFREQLWVGLRWTFCLGAAWWLSEVCNLITAYHHLDGVTLGTAAVILWGLLIAFAVPIGALHGLARYFAGRRDEVPWYRVSTNGSRTGSPIPNIDGPPRFSRS